MKSGVFLDVESASKIGMVGRKIPMAGQANVQDISEVQTSTDTRKALWETP